MVLLFPETVPMEKLVCSLASVSSDNASEVPD